jgi:hypothetical protein
MARLAQMGAIFVVMTLMFSSLGGAEIDPGTAVGIWLLDEGKGNAVKDFSGNRNDGNFVGNPKWVDGVFGKGLRFDGSDDMIPVGQNKVLRVEVGTMMNWINMATTEDVGLSSMTIPFDDGPAWDAPWRSLGLGTWQGQLRYWIAINGQNQEIQPGIIEKGRWYHEAITFDGEVRRAYLDGELKEEIAGKGEITYGRPTPTAVIGSASTAVPRELFNGDLDEIAIFNVVLSEDDINEIIENGLNDTLAVNPRGKVATTWAAIKSP